MQLKFLLGLFARILAGREGSMESQLIGKKEKTRMKGGRFIAETFKGYGLTHVFFVEAILRQVLVPMEALGIKRVLAHSEKAAAYMADGYARVSRRPGLCMSQSVGAANLASGLQDAYLGLSPVVAITGRRPPLALHRNAYQEIDHLPLFEPVTKFNAAVETVEQLPYLLRQALRQATSGAPGPAHLDVTDHVGRILENQEAELEVIVEEPFTRYPALRSLPEEKSLRDAAGVLEKAARPVIVAGGGAAASGAGAEITALAERLSIPVATSLAGKGTILETHPLSLGVVGTYSRWCANRVVSEADVVLFIGSRTGDQVTNEWKIPRMGTPVIQIDINPAELGRNYPNTVSLQGDAQATVRRLSELLTGRIPKTDWARHAQQIVQEWHREIAPLRNSDVLPIGPERLCREITEALPPDGILVSDTGFAGIWTGTMVVLTHPGQTYIRAAGSLGWAFPAALGAKCAAPDRPVVCFTGDGGFWYHLGEMETAMRCGIRTVTVINNNSCLSQPKRSVHRAYGERPGSPGDLYLFRSTDFARIAEEMGCLGIRVERPGELHGALKRALAADRPVIVDVVTDPERPAPDPWSPA
jgi:acetolactate synthase-1/2/3 large subunit